jgi:hypothetical protein
MEKLVPILIIFFSTISWAAELKCGLQGAVRCLCPASMSIDCGNGIAGYVDNEERPKALIVSVFDKSTGSAREITLPNPPNGVRSYYAGLERDEWLRSRLSKQNVTFNANTDIQVTSATFPDSLTLFQDPHKKAVARGGGSQQQGAKYRCYYLDEPRLAKSNKCGDAICTAKAMCWEGDRLLGEATVGCLGRGSQCPTASNCAADNSVETYTSQTATPDPFESQLRKKANEGVR